MSQRALLFLVIITAAGCSGDTSQKSDDAPTSTDADKKVAQSESKSQVVVAKTASVQRKSNSVRTKKQHKQPRRKTLIARRPSWSPPRLIGTPQLIRNTNTTVPLAAIVSFTTDRAVKASITIEGQAIRSTIHSSGPATKRHRIVAVGFHPNATHNIRITLHDKGGRTKTASQTLTIKAPPLPRDFPPLKCLVSKPKRMEPGVTIFNVFQWIDDAANESRGYIIAVDAAGKVVWYYRADHPISDVKQLPDGRMLYMRQHRDRPWTQAVEIDLLGNVRRSWYASARVEGDDKPKNSTPVKVDTLHHDVIPTPSGNFLAIATEVRRLAKYPVSETSPRVKQPANVVGDAVVEFQPDGKVVRKWSLLDLLDTSRIGYGSVSRFWDTRCYKAFASSGGTRDWSHANAIDYDAKTQTMVVSVRHQDAVVKIDCKTGKLVWILANPSGWRREFRKFLLKPKGKVDWPYHQHSPKRTDTGTLLVYDNGNYRATPPRAKISPARNASRVVEYAIDEKTMTVRQVWEYRSRRPVLCPLFGDVDKLPRTGNILITDGAILSDKRNRRTYKIPADRQWARIIEVDRSRDDEKVFELHIGNDEGGRYGWSLYRSERVRSLVGK